MFTWLRALAFDWLVIAISIFTFMHWSNPFTGLLAILLIGTRQHAIAVLGHDGAHHSICNNEELNDVLAKLCFLPFGISLARYRKFHFAHHRFVNIPTLDPERKLKAKAYPAWDLPTTPRHILLLCVKDFLVWPALREVIPFMSLVASPLAVPFVMLTWMLITYFIGWQPMVLWFTALSTSFWASNRLRIWCEHQGTNGVHCVRASWWQRFLFLPHNIGFHAEHHAKANIPFYELPAMRCQEGVTVWQLFQSYGGKPHEVESLS